MSTRGAHNFNGEHDQKGVLFNHIGFLRSVKPPSCTMVGQLMFICFPNPTELSAACSHIMLDCTEPVWNMMPANGQLHESDEGSVCKIWKTL